VQYGVRGERCGWRGSGGGSRCCSPTGAGGVGSRRRDVATRLCGTGNCASTCGGAARSTAPAPGPGAATPPPDRTRRATRGATGGRRPAAPGDASGEAGGSAGRARDASGGTSRAAPGTGGAADSRGGRGCGGARARCAGRAATDRRAPSRAPAAGRLRTG